jgi:hypothetical protein
MVIFGIVAVVVLLLAVAIVSTVLSNKEDK